MSFSLSSIDRAWPRVSCSIARCMTRRYSASGLLGMLSVCCRCHILGRATPCDVVMSTLCCGQTLHDVTVRRVISREIMFVAVC